MQGYAADDGAALRFVGSELREDVASREGARAYRIEPEVETPIETHVL